MNDPFFHAQVTAIAEQLLPLPGDTARIDAAFERLFQRAPTPDERRALLAFINAYPTPAPEQ